MTRATRRNAAAPALGSLVAAIALSGVLDAGTAAAQAPSPVHARFDAPPPDAIERGVALRKLGTTKSVLMIGAHPDDENTAVLAELALGHGADVAYLSLTRGEGGQNGIGAEQQEALGLLRTEELLAARAMDRGRQFFTRAYDFGFSKNAEEAFRHWPREELLEDVVRVVRAFRPDVIVAVFSGTPADGHGHHQASGIMAREAFAAAADPARFPDVGPPHAAVSLYRARFRGTEDATLVLETGGLDPLLGRSHHQVAMASRSEHRSQDMGQAQAMGPRQVGLDLVASRIEGDAPRSLFAGVDTTLSMRAERAAGQDARLADAAESLRRYEGSVAEPGAAGGDVALARAAAELEAALRSVLRVADERGGAPADDLLRALRREREQLHLALLLDAAVSVDVRADDATVVPGQTFTVAVSVWNGGPSAVRVERLGVEVPAGWTAVEEPSEDAAGGRSEDMVAERDAGLGGNGAGRGGVAGPEALAPGSVLRRAFRVGVPSGATPSIPYFLRAERDGDRYAWGNAEHAGEAFAPDPVRGAATVTLDPSGDGASPGSAAPVTIATSRAAAFVDVDRTIGEYRLPVLVLPGAAVALSPGVALVPASAPRPVDFSVRVTSNEPGPLEGVASLGLPPGWGSEPAEVRLEVSSGATGVANFQVTPPADVAPDEYHVAGLFRAPDGRAVETGLDVIDYPHIRPRLLPTRARAVLQVLDVAVPGDLTVAYVESAGDAGAAALEQLGIDTELLGPQDLAAGDLDRFDTIVLGIRAYEFRPDVAANNARLLDYARAGGTLIVQYNRYELPQGGFAPYPLAMSRPHDRVTDEAAEVTILEPGHRLFTWPNQIGPADFEGWVQERGLYFAGTWDERYRPLLEMADPGEAPLRGSLLIAPLGEGTYVYTALALFRQLPAGVPGAYRLLANLVALGADRPAASPRSRGSADE